MSTGLSIQHHVWNTNNPNTMSTGLSIQYHNYYTSIPSTPHRRVQMLPASLDTFTSPPPPYMPPMGTPPPYIQPMDTPPPYMPPMGTPPPYMPPMGTPPPYMPPMGTPPPYMPHGLDQSNSDGVLDTHRLYNHHYTNSYGYITPGVLEINTSVQQAPIVLDTEEHFDCSICLEHDSEGGGKLKCGHVFHKGCITKWFNSCKKTCPNCRLFLN